MSEKLEHSSELPEKSQIDPIEELTKIIGKNKQEKMIVIAGLGKERQSNLLAALAHLHLAEMVMPQIVFIQDQSELPGVLKELKIVDTDKMMDEAVEKIKLLEIKERGAKLEIFERPWEPWHRNAPKMPWGKRHKRKGYQK